MPLHAEFRESNKFTEGRNDSELDKRRESLYFDSSARKKYLTLYAIFYNSNTRVCMCDPWQEGPCKRFEPLGSIVIRAKFNDASTPQVWAVSHGSLFPQAAVDRNSWPQNVWCCVNTGTANCRHRTPTRQINHQH